MLSGQFVYSLNTGRGTTELTHTI